MRVYVDDVDICEKEKPLVADKPYDARVAFKRRAVREFEFWLTVAILCALMMLGWFFASGVLFG